MKTVIIAAIARNGVIGWGRRCAVHMIEGVEQSGRVVCRACGEPPREIVDSLPWARGTHPEYDAHLDAVTMGHAVIYGRRTWESLPPQHRPLKGRTNIVVTNTAHYERAEGDIDGPFHADSIEEALSMAGTDPYFAAFHSRAYIIGGAQLYAAALPLVDELDLTLIDRDYEGDVCFPCGNLFTHPSTEHVVDVGASPWSFSCIERRQGETPDLTFTKWVRR